MAEFMKQYAVLLKKARVDLKAAINLIHDLENLASLLNEQNIPFDLDIELLAELSDYAVEGRYAFLHEEIGDMEKYISMLSRVLDFPRG